MVQSPTVLFMVSGKAETSLSIVTTDEATKAAFALESSELIGKTSMVAYLSITAIASRQSDASTSFWLKSLLQFWETNAKYRYFYSRRSSLLYLLTMSKVTESQLLYPLGFVTVIVLFRVVFSPIKS
jgi:hypothetical protein